MTSGVDPHTCLLTINGGSSSIKFAVFDATPGTIRLLSGQIERAGQAGAAISASTADHVPEIFPIDAADLTAAAGALLDWIDKRLDDWTLIAIGHRLVFGGLRVNRHCRIDTAVMAELKRSQPLDSAHLPGEIALIDAVRRRHPMLPQFACFDTAFHREMPAVAKRLPIPRKYSDAGLQRFGFHGLSYTYLMDAVRSQFGDAVADGRVILAHLGSGASMAAVHQGRPIETTMGFTPLAGLVMGTRCGDLDPGVLLYLMRSEAMDADAIDNLLSKQSGMLGISGTSADMRDLSSRAATDERAAQAIELFCYRARQWIGSLVATLGGIDTLVFAGGVGEHAPDIRRQILAGLEFLGFSLDLEQNLANATDISASDSAIRVLVIPTDEEIVMANIMLRLLQN